jgi:ribonuclease-3
MNSLKRNLALECYVFNCPALLEKALTHKSAASEPGKNNERLEFIGDGILNAAMALEIFWRHPTLSEGGLSTLRAALVNTLTLADVARAAGLPDRLILAPSQEPEGRDNTSLLADAMEAVIAAVYFDAGFDQVRTLIVKLWAEPLAQYTDPEIAKDPRMRIREYAQQHRLVGPQFRLLTREGPEHARMYTAECRLDAMGIATKGQGYAKAEAERIAAARAMALIDAKMRHGSESRRV